MKQWAGQHKAKTIVSATYHIRPRLSYIFHQILLYLGRGMRLPFCVCYVTNGLFAKNQQANHSATYGKSPVYFHKQPEKKNQIEEIGVGLIVQHAKLRLLRQQQREKKSPPLRKQTISITCTSPAALSYYSYFEWIYVYRTAMGSKHFYALVGYGVSRTKSILNSHTSYQN